MDIYLHDWHSSSGDVKYFPLIYASLHTPRTKDLKRSLHIYNNKSMYQLAELKLLEYVKSPAFVDQNQ